MEGTDLMKKIYWFSVTILFALTAVFNVTARLVPGFSDFFREKAFPFLTFPLRTLTGFFKGSVGEIMIFSGLLLLAISLFCLIRLTLRRFQKKKAGKEVLYLKGFFLLSAVISLVMTFNCFILYQCTTFEELYFSEKNRKEYDFDDLAEVRNMIVEEVNTMAADFERDEDENLIYEPGMEAMKDSAVQAMQALQGEIPLLSGAYNRPKELYCSVFMSQQRMEGYYFPFSMEANINADMSRILKPAAMCHELVHTKGFLFEDEANFIAYLACIKSEDPYFRYSGYLSVLNYIDNDFYEACGSREKYDQYPAVSRQVRQDNRFLTDRARKKMEDNALLPTEKVEKAADDFINGNLALNGIPEGKLSYSEVVRLLLIYCSDGE